MFGIFSYLLFPCLRMFHAACLAVACVASLSKREFLAWLVWAMSCSRNHSWGAKKNPHQLSCFRCVKGYVVCANIGNTILWVSSSVFSKVLHSQLGHQTGQSKKINDFCLHFQLCLHLLKRYCVPGGSSLQLVVPNGGCHQPHWFQAVRSTDWNPRVFSWRNRLTVGHFNMDWPLLRLALLGEGAYSAVYKVGPQFLLPTLWFGEFFFGLHLACRHGRISTRIVVARSFDSQTMKSMR